MISKNHKLTRLFTSMKADVSFQFKHGFYVVYIFLALLYLVLLSQFDRNVTQTMLPIIVYIDPSFLGMFFVGSMVMLEKEQGILSLLYITPLRIREYLISKIVSLTALAIVVGFVISLLSYRYPVNYLLLGVGLILTSVFYTLIGFILSTGAKSVNEYMVNMIPWILLLAFPCFALIPNGFIPEFIYPFLNIIPSVAGIKLILGAYSPIPRWEVLLCCGSMIVFIAIVFNKTKKLFLEKVMLEN